MKARLNASPARLVLASGSPRRQAFLRELGLDFAVIVAALDETPLLHETPIAMASRLATSKARAVADLLPQDDVQRVVLAADTVVALDGLVMGKPCDAREATHMLAQLRNRSHQVHTAISLLAGSLEQTRVNTTTVWMRNYSDAEIGAYVASGDPMDKAGAYAIQHPVFSPAVRIDGCLSNVIGLPLADLQALLVSAGLVLPQAVAPICERQTNFACCQRTDVE